jgi:hypothetical protein
MASLTVPELLKFDWRINNFIQKYQNEEIFILNSGQKVTLTLDELILSVLRRKRPAEYYKLLFQDSKTPTRLYRIINFKQTPEFGGFDDRGTLDFHDRSYIVDSLNRQLNVIRSQTGKKTIDIKVQNKTFSVFRAQTSTGKANFSFVDEYDDEIFWATHNKNTNIRDFGDWSTLEPASIANHPETIAFIQAIEDRFDDLKVDFPSYLSIAMRIKDPNLKKYAVYGPDFGTGEALSNQNVNMIAQGEITLLNYAQYYKMHAFRFFENGSEIKGEYEPIFLASYNKETGGVKYAITPRYFRTVKEWIT